MHIGIRLLRKGRMWGGECLCLCWVCEVILTFPGRGCLIEVEKDGTVLFESQMGDVSLYRLSLLNLWQVDLDERGMTECLQLLTSEKKIPQRQKRI